MQARNVAAGGQRRRPGHRRLPTRDARLSLTERRLASGQGVVPRNELDGDAVHGPGQPAAEGFVIRHRAAKAKVLVLTPLSAELHGRLPEKKKADTSKLVVSPMPGLVVAQIDGRRRARRCAKARWSAIIEAMKMQNIIRAERDGVVKTP